ncbi:hypothetical protein Pcinc_021520, partial [Petrolisthes cinctipes]
EPESSSSQVTWGYIRLQRVNDYPACSSYTSSPHPVLGSSPPFVFCNVM